MPDNSAPAFPQTIDDMGTIRSVTEGMSQHKLIAMHCLSGILANSNINMTPSEYIINAYGYATALLAKYEKRDL